MKMKKYIVIFLIAILICASAIFYPSNVYAAGLSMSVSSSSVNVGKTITVNVSIPSGYGATVAVSYDDSILQFASCSVTHNANAGTLVLNIGDAFGFDSKATLTFKSVSDGTCRISANVTTAGNSEGDGVELSGASKTVTVNNVSSESEKTDSSKTDSKKNNDSNNEQLSSDGTLKSLVVSPGTLTPSFDSKTKNYSLSEEEGVSSIAVSAIPNDSKAKVVSVSGNEKLVPGQNKILIKVKAENGVTTTYSITVDVAGEITEELETERIHYTVNGIELYYNPEIPVNIIPENFEVGTTMVREKMCTALIAKGELLKLLYLSNDDGSVSGLYVYDSVNDMVHPCVIIHSGIHYIIPVPLDKETSPKDYNEVSLNLAGQGDFSAGQTDALNYYLIYAFSDEGIFNWYMYDNEKTSYIEYFEQKTSKVSEEPAQKSTEEPEETEAANDSGKELELENKIEKLTKYGEIVFIVMLFIIVASLMWGAAKSRLADGYFDDDDEDYDDENYDDDNYDDDDDEIENLDDDNYDDDESLENINLDDTDKYDSINSITEISTEEMQELLNNAEKLLQEVMSANKDSDKN